MEKIFEEQRREIYNAMIDSIPYCERDKIITKVIPFRNDDVPEFLKRFDEFEKKSRKTVIYVK